MVTVSGFSMVTPASISSCTLRSRKIRSTCGQFRARVDAQQLGRIVDFHGGHAMAGAVQDLDDVGQIVFVSRIIGTDFEHVLPQQVRAETIDAGVDERDRELRGRGGFVLHDGAARSSAVVSPKMMRP